MLNHGKVFVSSAAISRRAEFSPSRLLVPSLFDLLLIALFLWTFVLIASSWDSFAADANTGVHIQTGEIVLNQGGVPHTDPFTFTKGGEPWYAFEWLTGVLYACIHRICGLRGILAISSLMVIAFLGIMLRDMLRRGTDVLIALFLCLLAYRAASIHFLARPHLLTMLLFAFTVWLVAIDRERPSKAVWILVPLCLLWTNLHGGFVLLLVYLGLLSVGTSVEALIRPLERTQLILMARRYSVLTVLCAAVSIINPYGIYLHLHIYRLLGSKWLAKMIQEHASPFTMLEERVYYYLALAALGAVAFLFLAGRRRVVEPLWIAFLTYSSMVSARHITVFVIGVTPLIAVELSRLWRNMPVGEGPRSLAAIFRSLSADMAPAFRRMSIWPPVLAAALLLGILPVGAPNEFPKSEFPADMIVRNEHLLASGRVFSTDHWGDYLIYRLYPKMRVFIDGRGDLFGPELGAEYLTILEGSQGWREGLDRWKCNVVLCPVDKPLAGLIAKEPGWHIVEKSSLAILAFREANAAPAKIIQGN